MAKEIKIKIRDLHKSFGKKHVLNGVDLDLYKGESLVVIGGSGTGKSVLIKCIQGLLIPDSGSIEIDDIEIANENPDVIDSMHSKMGMLFQGGALFDSLTVWENVAFDLIQNRGFSKKEAKIVAIKVLRQVGLTEDIADLYPSELSGGMQKRVGLARAVITRPEIIFFDEPTTGLDVITARVVTDFLQEIKKEGKSILISTHIFELVEKICDRVGIIINGKMIASGNLEEVKNGMSLEDRFFEIYKETVGDAV